MKIRLSEREFQTALEGLKIRPQTRDMAHAVLVQGESQTAVSERFGLGKAAVSRAVKQFLPPADKKKLTDDQFQAAIKDVDMPERTKEVVYAVLVRGESQTALSQSSRLSQGTISQATSRVWDAFLRQNVPDGYQRVEVLLPDHQAYIVQKWSAEALKKLGLKK